MTRRDPLESRLIRFLREHGGPDRPDGLLIAVSGGLDSTALLHLCLATADRHGRRLVAGHVNHGVRPDADAEETRLRGVCARLSIPFREARLSFPGAPDRAPSEEEMRRARLAALERMAREEGCGFVLLAHQRDDQAETLLLNLIRGAGLRGLAGMAPRRGIFLRPLLDAPRSRLRRYLEGIGAAWVDDPTNEDLARARNRIRHRLIPWIEAQLQPRAGEAIARASAHLRAARTALEAEADRVLAESRLPGPEGEIRLDAARLRRYDRALSEFVIRQAVGRVRGTTRGVPAPLWHRIVELHRSRRDGWFLLPGGTRVELTGRAVRVCHELAPSPAPVGPQGIEVPWRGRCRFGTEGEVASRLLRLRRPLARFKLHGLARLQAFDADELRPPVRLRLPRAGDRVAQEDCTGSRKLSDLLSERGVPRSLRARQPVLVDGSGILWVPGVRRAGSARIGPGTRRIWVARWFGPLPADQAIAGGMSRA